MNFLHKKLLGHIVQTRNKSVKEFSLFVLKSSLKQQMKQKLLIIVKLLSNLNILSTEGITLPIGYVTH